MSTASYWSYWPWNPSYFTWVSQCTSASSDGLSVSDGLSFSGSWESSISGDLRDGEDLDSAISGEHGEDGRSGLSFITMEPLLLFRFGRESTFGTGRYYDFQNQEHCHREPEWNTTREESRHTLSSSAGLLSASRNSIVLDAHKVHTNWPQIWHLVLLKLSKRLQHKTGRATDEEFNLSQFKFVVADLARITLNYRIKRIFSRQWDFQRF